ncbi:MAG: FtsH protease activity modulator HflK [Rhodospirillaceae bacterium]
MFWKQQGSGPWGGGGSGGPWGGKGGKGGRGGNGGGDGGGSWGGGQPPPDLEELLKRSQDRVKQFIPGGMGSSRGILIVIAAVLVIWGASGFYRVQPDEQGVELLFGSYVKTTQPGLNYWFPGPVGEVQTPKVTLTNQITVGFRGVPNTTNLRDVPAESLMLTGDENIVDVDFVVQWRIRDAGDFLFNIRAPEQTVKLAAESAMREVVGQNTLDFVTTGGREVVGQTAQTVLQEILDSYGSGISILEIRVQGANPPPEVIDAFNDVQRANQDQERLRNEATAYRNDIVPRAKGEASRMIENASAEKEKLIREAQGAAQRFDAFYETYRNNKDVTSRRLYLEAMQEVFSKSEKVIMDDNGQGNGVVPYLPLNQLQRARDGGTN